MILDEDPWGIVSELPDAEYCVAVFKRPEDSRPYRSMCQKSVFHPCALFVEEFPGPAFIDPKNSILFYVQRVRIESPFEEVFNTVIDGHTYLITYKILSLGKEFSSVSRCRIGNEFGDYNLVFSGADGSFLETDDPDVFVVSVEEV